MVMTGLYSKPRILIISKGHKSAKRILEVFDDNFQVSYTTKIDPEKFDVSDAAVFDYINDNIVDISSKNNILNIYLINDVSEVEKYNLRYGEYLLRGPGYLRFLPELIITLLERKLCNNQLNFEVNKYMDLLMKLNFGILLLRKRNGTIFFANNYALKLMDLKIDEVRNKRIEDLNIFEDIEKFKLDDHNFNKKIDVLRKNDEKLPVVFSSNETLFGAQKIIQFVFTNLDKV